MIVDTWEKSGTNDRLSKESAGGDIWSKRIIYRVQRQFRNQRKRPLLLKAVD
jgi:hypothetical protein